MKNVTQGNPSVNNKYGGLEFNPHFILLSLETDQKTKQIKKVPLRSVRYGLQKGDLYNSEKWLSFEQAIAMIENEKRFEPGKRYFLGFVFVENVGYFFIDLDNCIDVNGSVSSWALGIINLFPDCFVEVSQSGKGIHIIGKRSRDFISYNQYKQNYKNSVNIDTGKLEFYFHKRYVALTGTTLYGLTGLNSAQTISGNLSAFCDLYLKQNKVTVDNSFLSAWDTPRSDWNGIKTDKELIKKMIQSSGSAGALFGDKLKFEDLWKRNDTKLSEIYPGSNDGFDWSKADLSLCSHLAFWTGCHGERIDRLFRQSGLMRGKWDRTDYKFRTINKAIASCKRVHNLKFTRAPGSVPGINTQEVKKLTSKPTEVNSETSEQPSGAVGFLKFVLTPEQQINHFKYCVYIKNQKAVYDVRKGDFYDHEQFDDAHGNYSFMTGEQNKDGTYKTIGKAWIAFIYCKFFRFSKVDYTAFQPERTPGEIWTQERLIYFNTYTPIETPCMDGDVTFFKDFIYRMYPNELDRNILLSYIAGIVQFPGVKAQWAPILQGVKGNGKTTLAEILRFCVGRRYSHTQNSGDIGNKFNAWIERKLLIIVDEFFIPAEDFSKVMRIFHSLLTDLTVPVQAKGKNQTETDNRANFLLLTNRKDAVKITKNTRRFTMLSAAQQNVEDLERTGLTTSYFLKFRNWLFKESGLEKINNFLRRLNTTELGYDIRNCLRAPKSSVSDEIFKIAVDPIHAFVLNLILENKIGFRKGWISSYWLTLYLRDNLAKTKENMRIINSPYHRNELMRNIQYELHPGLKSREMKQKIAMDDNARSRLYVRIGHPHSNLTDTTAIREAYEADQKE
jgi:primase-polymerase (primpol)-like protein